MESLSILYQGEDNSATHDGSASENILRNPFTWSSDLKAALISTYKRPEHDIGVSHGIAASSTGAGRGQTIDGSKCVNMANRHLTGTKADNVAILLVKLVKYQVTFWYLMPNL